MAPCWISSLAICRWSSVMVHAMATQLRGLGRLPAHEIQTRLVTPAGSFGFAPSASKRATTSSRPW